MEVNPVHCLFYFIFMYDIFIGIVNLSSRSMQIGRSTVLLHL